MSRRRQRGLNWVSCIGTGGAVVSRPRPPGLDWVGCVADILTSAVGSLPIIEAEPRRRGLGDAVVDEAAVGHHRAEATTEHAARRPEVRS